jgi:hypothetical protein
MRSIWLLYTWLPGRNHDSVSMKHTSEVEPGRRYLFISGLPTCRGNSPKKANFRILLKPFRAIFRPISGLLQYSILSLPHQTDWKISPRWTLGTQTLISQEAKPRVQPLFYIANVGGEPRVKPGGWRPEMWALMSYLSTNPGSLLPPLTFHK